MKLRLGAVIACTLIFAPTAAAARTGPITGSRPVSAPERTIQPQNVTPVCLDRSDIPQSELHWLQIPANASDLATSEDYAYLSGQLIQAGVVNASDCPLGGLWPDAYLYILKDSELLYERGIYPQSNYIFKHALTREVVYDSILAKRKKKLHEEIGNAIEELYKDNLNGYYEMLAEHFIKSENYERGAEYLRLAARKAQKAASFKDAIIHAEKRTSCLEKLPRNEDVEKNIVDSRLTLGLYNIQSSYFNEAKEAIDPIVDLAVKRGDKKTSQIYTILGTHIFVSQEDYPKAFQYLQEALKIAEQSKDFVTLWVASHWMGHALAENCEFEKALVQLERDLQISTFANIRWSISIMKSCIAMNIYCNQGKVDLAYQTSHEGLKLAEESGDTFSKAEAYTSCGYSSLLKGFLDQALFPLNGAGRL